MLKAAHYFTPICYGALLVWIGPPAQMKWPRQINNDFSSESISTASADSRHAPAISDKQ